MVEHCTLVTWKDEAGEKYFADGLRCIVMATLPNPLGFVRWLSFSAEYITVSMIRGFQSNKNVEIAIETFSAQNWSHCITNECRFCVHINKNW